MAIQLRRGNEADLDISQLKPGEAAICLDSGKVIIKLAGGNYLTLTDSVELSALISGKADASHSHETATTAASGFLSAADKTKLDAINAGTKVLLRSGTAVNLLNETNQELDLGENVDLLNYTAIEIRFLQYSTTINNESINLYSTLRAVNTGVGYGNIPAVKYNDSANGIASNICFLTLSGSKIKVVSAGSASQFFISTVIGYK